MSGFDPLRTLSPSDMLRVMSGRPVSLFAVAAMFWVAIGLPALLLGAMWNGGFDVIIDAPPYLQRYPDRSILGNGIWLLGAALVYMPVYLLPLWLLLRWRKRTRQGQQDTSG